MSEINKSWNVIRAILQNNFKFYEIKEIVGLAGFNVTLISHLEQKAGGGASKGQLITAIDKGFAQTENKTHFISIVVEEILKRKNHLENELQQYLNRLELTIAERKVLPIELLDTSELAELPADAQQDLVKAIERFRNGDLSGAVSSACAAIDSVTSKIYIKKDLGDHGSASFQEKCKKSIQALCVMDKIKNDLKELGWKEVDIFVKNLEGSLNQAAYVMQSLRSKMGDVHGTKPTLKPLVYDSLKWASLILRILNEK
ncbi:hypothetical protein SAMN02745206_01527 [Desulfacinum infernum DSM 9756]|uniref:Abortive infection C-terminus n=1 Tax=Desulfacinum infernum DSM 9756 TaxID=1121391 RepID=A0A1M4ZPG4_9BACT|nr:hypothetical protein [Desulfacinum infernum]SHF19881.1 hypothetical protein SAMN02745206_01527 [Desulfacinum infernum DSM 9756]